MGARDRNVGVNNTEMIFDVMSLQGTTQGESEDGENVQELSHGVINTEVWEEEETN